MRDYDNPRPGSRAGIASALSSITLRESRPTSVSSFSDLSASSTNIYSTHARRVRSIRKLRQVLGPEDTVDRVDSTAEKELPLPLPPPTPLFSSFLDPPNDDSTITSSSPTSDFASEEDETREEKSTSLVYARLVKLEKLKRQFGEEVPKELVFLDQPHHPSSHMLRHRRRSLSSPNIMKFGEEKYESLLGHSKAASVSTIPIANVVSQVALRRSRATRTAWKAKGSKRQPAGDIDNGDDGAWMRIIKGERNLDAKVVDDTSCPDRLTSLQGSDWGYISKSDDKAMDVNHTTFMQPQFNTSNEDLHIDLQKVRIVRSHSTLVINRTSEDDERTQVHSTVESSNKSMISVVTDSSIDSEQLQESSDSLYPLTLRPGHDETLGNNQPTDPAHSPRKVRSAVALASQSRNPTSLPVSASTSYSGEPSSSTPTSHHRKETLWNDENMGSSPEDDRRMSRSISRGSKPKGPRPSSRSRPTTADSSLTTTPTTITPSNGFCHFDEAVEHWQLLEKQHKVQKPNKPASPKSNSRAPSPLLSNRDSLPPPPLPTKSPIISKKFSQKLDESNDPPPPPITGPSVQKTTMKTTATMVYFYHRGVVRLAVDEGTRGPKTVHMRDVLNYLREMRYVH